MKSQSSIALVALLLPLLTAAAAAEHSRPAASPAVPKGGCIVLTTAAEQQKSITAEDGSNTVQYQPAARVVPGSEVVWTTTARNTCARQADKVVIEQPVPEHMVFVADSAMGGGAQITLSVDGKDYLPASALTVRNTDGSTRPARATDVRSVRWTLNTPIAPQSEFSARFRAVLQ